MSRQNIEHYYIHWPFCKNKCHYCDFVAFEKHEELIGSYHTALMSEIKDFFKQNPEHSKNGKTLFWGGGTPSLYPLNLLQETTELLFSQIDQAIVQEMTIEVNPSGVTHEMLSTWKALGFNRFSVGVQILNDAALHALNRKQTTHDVLTLFDKIFMYQANVSVDLIIGLPGVTEEDWWTTLQTILQWPIKHISIYFLTIHENTPLAHRIARKELAAASDDEMVRLYQETIALLARHGIMQYEISNFAIPGYESTHNYAYWQRKAYKGFGLGAASLYDEQRFVNQKSLTAYLRQWEEGKIEQNGKAAPLYEKITDEQNRLERYMLGLRQTKGIPLDELLYRLDLDKQKEMHHSLSWLEKEGFLIVDHDMVRLTPRGMVYENEIVTKLY